MLFPRRRLEVEALESRLVPSTMDNATVSDTPPPTEATAVIYEMPAETDPYVVLCDTGPSTICTSAASMPAEEYVIDPASVMPGETTVDLTLNIDVVGETLPLDTTPMSDPATPIDPIPIDPMPMDPISIDPMLMDPMPMDAVLGLDSDATSADAGNVGMTPDAAPGDILPIDSTALPVDSGNITTNVLVSSVEPATEDRIYSFTVLGLTSETLQAYTLVSFTVGEHSYVVDQAIDRGNGEFTLVVLGGVGATEVQVAQNLTLTLGSGGSLVITPPDTAASEPPPGDTTPTGDIPPIDPTEQPT